MTYDVHFDPEINCIFMHVSGRVTLEVIRELAIRVSGICAEKKCYRVLNDMRTATVKISIPDLYAVPKTMSESGLPRRLMRALVVPSDFDDSEFLENVTRNRGHNLMVFKDIEKAKEWLKLG